MRMQGMRMQRNRMQRMNMQRMRCISHGRITPGCPSTPDAHHPRMHITPGYASPPDAHHPQMRLTPGCRTRKKSAKNRLFGHLSFIAARVKCDMPAIPNVGGIFRRRHISGKLVTALCGGVAGNVFRSPQLRQGTSLLQCFTCDVTIWSKMAGRLFSPPAACTAATR